MATAVAASAAYPLLLPALDRTWSFDHRDGSQREQRVVLTDGGVFDNSGTSCLRPGRSADHSYNVFDYVIACDAGRGQLADKVPFHIASRLNRAFEGTSRKLQDTARSALHDQERHSELKGFVMPYSASRTPSCRGRRLTSCRATRSPTTRQTSQRCTPKRCAA